MDINKELKRAINNGQQFDKYFEKVSCNATFEKKGDTTAVLHIMRKDAVKYAYQTKAIAQQLKGSTVEQTVNNTYNFLYNNVQYEIDGYDQNLRSPACSWQQRHVGIDCKSYAIFASTILQNLGIEHYFRKVKQTYYNPQKWSHVYVVIKDGNNTLVIDPTIHSNNEVNYVQKKDIKVSKLPIYTLNAGVQQQPTTNNRDSEILQGFFQLSNVFEKIGVSNHTISKIKDLVETSYYKHKNFNFPFKLLPNDILLIDGNKIPLNPTGLNGGALYGVVTGTQIGIDSSMFNTGITPTLATQQPIGSNSSGFFSSSGVGGNLIAQVGQQSGSKVVSAAAALATDPSGMTSLMTLLPMGDIMDNVNNVLKYGLSSWGASTNPEKIKTDIQKYMTYLQGVMSNIQKATTTKALQDNINELERASRYYSEMFAASLQRRSWAGSTEAAFQLEDKTFDDFYAKYVAPLMQNLSNAGYTYTTSRASAKFGDLDVIYQGPESDQNTTAEKNGSFNYNVYTITGVPSKTNSNSNVAPKYNADGTPIKPTSKTSTMGKVLGYGTAAALAAFVLIPEKKKQPKTK